MDDLIVFLRAQLDEDERIALKSVEQAIVNLAGADAASVADWHVVERPATGSFVATRDQWDRVTEIVPTYGGAHAEHIATHDPARVLREIDAKRRMLDWLARKDDWALDNNLWTWDSDDALCLLALPFADRPGYQEGWAP